MVLSAMPENANYWDEQLAKVMFGYDEKFKLALSFPLL
jgi:hypothetical protein